MDRLAQSEALKMNSLVTLMDIFQTEENCTFYSWFSLPLLKASFLQGAVG